MYTICTYCDGLTYTLAVNSLLAIYYGGPFWSESWCIESMSAALFSFTSHTANPGPSTHPDISAYLYTNFNLK